MALVLAALASFCAPLIAQTVVANITALRTGALSAGTSVILTEYANPLDGGGGLFYSTAISCSLSGNATSVSGKTVTVSPGFAFSKLALNMWFTGLGVTNDPVTAFSATSLTITLLNAPSMSSGSFSLNGDNGGTIIVQASGNVCFYRASQTYSQAEWGVGSTSDDTSYLQNWIDAPQPHIAVPGNSIISSTLYCGGNDGSGNPIHAGTVIEGPPAASSGAGSGGQPGFLITAADVGGGTWNGGTGLPMLSFNQNLCGISAVGVI